ncbi:hypothetical protein RhiJN_27288 [Ceratobasidium sp. AG-Ba]|nr:hypothetical protein RhiJN_27288 [Ceratobasidium sp. AG-Ba]
MGKQVSAALNKQEEAIKKLKADTETLQETLQVVEERISNTDIMDQHHQWEPEAEFFSAQVEMSCQRPSARKIRNSRSASVKIPACQSRRWSRNHIWVPVSAKNPSILAPCRNPAVPATGSCEANF